MSAITLTFAWPADTSANARLHWANRARMVKANRAEGFYVARQFTAEGLPPGKYTATFTFYPPTRRRYDDDNLMARVKGHRDGFCQALGIDDNCLHAVLAFGAVEKPGRVVVTIEAMTA